MAHRDRRGVLALLLAMVLLMAGCSTEVVTGQASAKYPMPKLADPENIPELDPLDESPTWSQFIDSLETSVKRGTSNGTVSDISRLAAIVDALSDADHSDPGVQAIMRTVMRAARTPSHPPPTIEQSGKAASAGTLDWQPCGDDGLECASLQVPVDYDNPGGETIEIKIDRYPATDPAKRIGVLLSNPGGPGGSGLDFLPGWYESLSDEIKASFDIISFDPRGVGQSDGLTCGNVDTSANPNPYPNGDAEEDEFTEYAEDAAAACQQAGPLLDHVGAVNVVKDMEEMRKAMGEEQISYVGYSYGTVLGQVYANLYPESLRATVLDGMVDTAITKQELSSKQNAAFDNALRRFAKTCPEACTGLAQYVVQQAAQTPYPSKYLTSEESVDDYIASLSISSMLRTPENWPLLAWSLREAAANGDGTLLMLIAELGAGISIFDGSVSGGDGLSGDAFNAVMCEDFDVSPLDEAYQMARTDNRLHPVFASPPDVLCNVWPTEREPLGPLTWPEDLPMLLVSTTGDPATPHSMAQTVVSRNPSAVLLTHNGDGHTVYGGEDECVDANVDKFLIDLELPEKGTVCK